MGYSRGDNSRHDTGDHHGRLHGLYGILGGLARHLTVDNLLDPFLSSF